MARKLSEQVLVITGASSGIGRETAIEAGKRGASVVLAARNTIALREVAGEIEAAGGRVHVVVTDVSKWDQMQRLAQEAMSRFGRIDTWVNDASVAVYGSVEQTTVEEYERIVQVNLLGMIYGVKAALPYMQNQPSATIINIGSVESRRAIPLHSAYAATKFGVKGFTDALRVEMMRDHPNIHVTLIMPASINTPFFRHSRSKLGVEPAPLPPVYEPHLVAEAILFAAENPRREIIVGGMGRMIDMMEKLSPRFNDLFFLQTGFSMQKTNRPDGGQDNLYEPIPEAGSARGEFGQHANSVSPMTKLDFYPNLQRAMLAMLISGSLLMLRRSTK